MEGVPSTGMLARHSCGQRRLRPPMSTAGAVRRAPTRSLRWSLPLLRRPALKEAQKAGQQATHPASHLYTAALALSSTQSMEGRLSSSYLDTARTARGFDPVPNSSVWHLLGYPAQPLS